MNDTAYMRPAARAFRSAFFNVGPAMDFSSIYAPRAGRPPTTAARLELSARRAAAAWGRVGRRLMRKIGEEAARVVCKNEGARR